MNDADRVDRLRQWLDQTSAPGWAWYVKRLSGNDTVLTGSHQAGPYFPSRVVFDLLPGLKDPGAENPRVGLPVSVSSHGGTPRPISAIWYNNKLRGGTRDECRLTGWGGASSPVLDPEATGSVAVFAFEQRGHEENAKRCLVWLCSTVAEEDYLEGLHGPIEPGEWRFVRHGGGLFESPVYQATPQETDLVGAIPARWYEQFPSGRDITDLIVELYPEHRRLSPDDRLLRRRDAEYRLFRLLETQHVMPTVSDGFSSVDAFVDYAHSVTNRRKARSGKSLEYQLSRIFEEEGVQGFGHDCVTEGRKRPDFVFPSQSAYRDPRFPTDRLRMLAVKTTCKDRWRQVTTEADRIARKHLLTLQEGLSVSQIDEMDAKGVSLVVPKPIQRKFPQEARPRLQSLSEFVSSVSDLASCD